MFQVRALECCSQRPLVPREHLFIQVKMLCFMLSDDHMIARLTVAAHFTAGLDSLVRLCRGVSVKL